MTRTDAALGDAIAQGYDERDRDDMAPTIAYFRELLERYPGNPIALYEVGGAYDTAGDEEEAVGYYEQALSAGLDGTELRRCHVQLGSTLRNLGRDDESVAVLRAGLDEFPGSRSLRTFLALALNDLGRHDEAVGLLLEVLIDPAPSPDLVHYGVALRGYAADLRERGGAQAPKAGDVPS